MGRTDNYFLIHTAEWHDYDDFWWNYDYQEACWELGLTWDQMWPCIGPCFPA